MSQMQERIDHARNEFNYYAREINNPDYPPAMRHAVSALTVLALPLFTARAFVMNDGLYRSQQATNDEKPPQKPQEPQEPSGP